MPDPLPKTKPKTEEQWEEEVLAETLDKVLKPDGTLDFDALRKKGITLTLDELYPEGEAEDEP